MDRDEARTYYGEVLETFYQEEDISYDEFEAPTLTFVEDPAYASNDGENNELAVWDGFLDGASPAFFRQRMQDRIAKFYDSQRREYDPLDRFQP